MVGKMNTNSGAHNWLVYKRNDQFLKEHVSLYRGVLYDLGAGESPYRDFFLQHADRYVAVDWGKSLHDTNVDILADLNEALPVESGVADTVVSLSVMEHLREPQMMLNEASRILKSGGHLVLQVPWQWWIHEAPHDYFRYTPYGLKYLLEKAGFVEVSVRPQVGFFSMIVLKLNYFSKRFVRGPWLLRRLIKLVLLPFWFVGQVLAPLFDKLDWNWAAETTGYFVTAKKP
tara:strand:- start:21453 stop:22142 length:690 start_codon:yes stop_codon:yes gene_type:complete